MSTNTIENRYANHLEHQARKAMESASGHEFSDAEWQNVKLALLQYAKRLLAWQKAPIATKVKYQENFK